MLIHRPLRQTQRTLRLESSFIAAERATMKDYSATEKAATKAYGERCGMEHRPDAMHSPQVHGFCFSASQRKAK
jgi:hypothetical protein